MIDHDDVDDFAERVAQPLRASEQLDTSFDTRVMSAIHASERAKMPKGPARGGWLHREVVVRVSPLSGFVMAAGVTAVIAFGAVAGWRAHEMLRPSIASSGNVVAVAPETVRVVRFVFTDRTAQAVALVGDFNAWARDATPLVQQWREGLWVVSVAIPPGRHEYAFLVRRAGGEEWVADPLAATVRDEFGTESSVVVVDGSRGSVGGAS